jgi:uncharacterized small protein (DUF1192 family)
MTDVWTHKMLINNVNELHDEIDWLHRTICNRADAELAALKKKDKVIADLKERVAVLEALVPRVEEDGWAG